MGVGIIGLNLIFMQGEAIGKEWIWKFNVEIDLKKIKKQIKYVGIMAAVYDKNETAVASVKKVVPINTKTGSLKTTKDNPINLYILEKDLVPGKKASDGKKYIVFFYLSTNGQDVIMPNGPNDLAKVKPATEFVPKADGPLVVDIKF